MAPKKPTKKEKKQVPAKRHELAEALRAVLRARFGVCAGEPLGVAVSGGADSTALLRLMVELREELGVVVCVAHFNHKLRGKASDADEKFVEKLAAQHGLEFLVARENIAAKAKRERTNLEDAARRARYAFFERLVKEGRVARVAVAQTADDQAETVLAHILRGTGLAGLAGIHPQAGSVFRPLLQMRRAALRAYLRSRKQPWREDATNRDVTRTRSRIRHKLLPLLETQFQTAAVEHFCQLAQLALEDNAYLEKEAARRLTAVSRERKDGIAIGVGYLVSLASKTTRSGAGAILEELPDTGAAFDERVGAGTPVAQAGVPVPLAKRMVRQLVMRLKPHSGELGARHVEAVLHLLAWGHSGQLLELPGGVEVRRERDALVFRAAAPGSSNSEPATFSLHLRLPAIGAELRINALSRILRVRVIDWPREGRETINTGAVLDCSRLREPLVLRNWRTGDALKPVGHQNQHTVARLLNELGISRWEKASWPVLTSAGRLAWVLGLPVASEFAAVEGSRAAVVITEESSS
ncbi:MAG TPA: tRNA lysidine(34) synthetase TilS [Candidatus Limnocylindrales bacterium]|nr:tRNA lysidine(34) synthetase TilS [Candidatus Limnocylindrales bacterium]